MAAFFIAAAVPPLPIVLVSPPRRIHSGLFGAVGFIKQRVGFYRGREMLKVLKSPNAHAHMPHVHLKLISNSKLMSRLEYVLNYYHTPQAFASLGSTAYFLNFMVLMAVSNAF